MAQPVPCLDHPLREVVQSLAPLREGGEAARAATATLAGVYEALGVEVPETLGDEAY